MNLAEVIRDHMSITKSTKADACKRNNGPTDLVPMIVWIDEDDQTNVAVVEVKGNTMEYMPKVLAFMAQQNPKAVVFIAESLAKTVDSPEDLEKYLAGHKPGDLRKQYEARGPLSGIQELIAFNGIDMVTGRQAQGVVKFSYDDQGMPVFDETEVNEVPENHVDKANMTWLFDKFYGFMKAQQAEQN